MFNLKDSIPEMALAPLSVIDKSLTNILGPEWIYWEPETISIELGVVSDPLLLDKTYVLKIMHNDVSLALEDVSFFVHAVNVINNNIADFDSFGMPTSLELAFTLDQYKKILGEHFKITSMIEEVCSFVLLEEGYSKVPEQFSFVKAERLHPGQSSEDTKNKQLAIDEYVKGMNSL